MGDGVMRRSRWQGHLGRRSEMLETMLRGWRMLDSPQLLRLSSSAPSMYSSSALQSSGTHHPTTR